MSLQNYHGMMNLKIAHIKDVLYHLRISAMTLAIKKRMKFRLNRAAWKM
nr:protein P [Bovine ephemeral fever virus]